MRGDVRRPPPIGAAVGLTTAASSALNAAQPASVLASTQPHYTWTDIKDGTGLDRGWVPCERHIGSPAPSPGVSLHAAAGSGMRMSVDADLAPRPGEEGNLERHHQPSGRPRVSALLCALRLR